MNVKIVLISLFLAARASAMKNSPTAAVLKVGADFFFLYDEDGIPANGVTGGCKLTEDQAKAVKLDSDTSITVEPSKGPFKLAVLKDDQDTKWKEGFDSSKDKNLENACKIDIKIVHNGSIFIYKKASAEATKGTFCYVQINNFQVLKKADQNALEFKKEGTMKAGADCSIDVAVTDN